VAGACARFGVRLTPRGGSDRVDGAGEDGALRVHSDAPPGATGSLDYRVPVTDTTAWVQALTEAGVRPAAG